MLQVWRVKARAPLAPVRKRMTREPQVIPQMSGAKRRRCYYRINDAHRADSKRPVTGRFDGPGYAFNYLLFAQHDQEIEWFRFADSERS